MTPSDPCPKKAFPKLADLIEYLESLEGRADLAVLSRLLETTALCAADIAPVCIFGERGYKRNTIARSEHFELLALCWRSGDSTPIHDHRGNSCAFKVVAGTGTEIRFQPTDSGLVCPMTTTSMAPGYICSADDPDIHMVANMQPKGQDLVTLHIYSPPIAKMNTFTFAKPTVVESGICVGVGDGI